MSKIDIIVIPITIIAVTIIILLYMQSKKKNNNNSVTVREHDKEYFTDGTLSTQQVEYTKPITQVQSESNENTYNLNENQKLDSVPKENVKHNENIRKTDETHVQYPDIDDMVDYTGDNDNNNNNNNKDNKNKDNKMSLSCKNIGNGQLNCVETIEHKNTQSKNNNMCNKSIDDNRINAYKYYSQNKKGHDITFPICRPEDNHINEDEIDITECYRQNMIFYKSYLEDPVVRGGNLNSFDNNATLDQIGKISLRDNYNNPKPLGYVFESSSAYER